MHIFLFLALLLWPFGPPRPLTPGHHHSRAAHAKQLARIQSHRHHQQAKRRAALQATSATKRLN